jgi:hypothetical protein
MITAIDIHVRQTVVGTRFRSREYLAGNHQLKYRSASNVAEVTPTGPASSANDTISLQRDVCNSRLA